MRRFIPFAIPSGTSPAVQTQTKSAEITTNGGSVTVQPDSGYLLSSVTATANIPTEEKSQSITANGTYTIAPSSGKLMTKASVLVNVPTGGGLAEGQVAVHDIPNGKIISAQVVLSESTPDNEVTATITLPESLSGELPDYIILVGDKHTKAGNHQSFEYAANINGSYSIYGGIWYSGSGHTWNSINSSAAAPSASVNGTALTLKAGNNATYKWSAGVVTFYAIYTSDDAT